MFADHPPFNELSERILIDDLESPYSMVSNEADRSILISDQDCIWKVQLPGKEVSRWNIPDWKPELLSITPNGELLVVVEVKRPDVGGVGGGDDDEEEEEREKEEQEADGYTDRNNIFYNIDIISLADFSRTKSIPLPERIPLRLVCGSTNRLKLRRVPFIAHP